MIFIKINFIRYQKKTVVDTYLKNIMKNDRLFELQEHFSHHINVPCFDLTKGNIYVEIGSFYGHSASVIASVFDNKKIICIDIFNNSYFKSVGRKETDWNCPPKNYKIIAEKSINKCNNNNEVHYIEGLSCSEKTINKLNKILNNDKIDLSFIDGDHTYQSVINDFEKYFPLVKNKGFIIFDDYHQPWNAAKKPVDDICIKYESEIHVLGLPKDNIKIHEEEKKYKLPYSMRKDMDTTHNNTFIIQKK